MNKSNLKIYIFILIVVLLLLFIAVILITNKKISPTNDSQIHVTSAPIPTLIKLPSKTTNTITPTLVQPTFTGVKLEELSKEITDLATQKQEFKRKLPLKEDGFTITFDFANDKFIVALKGPKQVTRIMFSSWKEKNCTAIPIDRFILN